MPKGFSETPKKGQSTLDKFAFTVSVNTKPEVASGIEAVDIIAAAILPCSQSLPQHSVASNTTDAMPLCRDDAENEVTTTVDDAKLVLQVEIPDPTLAHDLDPKGCSFGSGVSNSSKVSDGISSIVISDSSDKEADNGSDSETPRPTSSDLNTTVDEEHRVHSTTPNAKKKSSADAVTPRVSSMIGKSPATLPRTRKKLSAEESARKKAERERIRLEKMAKLEAEKAEKERRRLEAEAARMKKKHDEEIKKQERLKEIEERKKAKELEAQQKAEEKKQKEEARIEEKKRKEEELILEKKRKEEEKVEEKRKKEEERKQIELEKSMQAEEEARKKKEQFLKFFKPIAKPVEPIKPKAEGRFKPFMVKEGMVLAPTLRREKLREDQMIHLDTLLQKQTCARNELYLAELKARSHTVLRSKRTLPREQDEIQIIDDVNPGPQRYRVKLLQFKENYRPAYYGTWRKKSKAFTGRRPFGKDTEQLDYEVDSEEEWEEEPEDGEECKTDEEDEGSDVEDEQDDDGFFVPHNYLSSDEGEKDEDEEKLEPEVRLERAKIKDKLWREEKLFRKFQKLVPICAGVFLGETIASDGLDSAVLEMLNSCTIVVDHIPDPSVSLPLLEADGLVEDCAASSNQAPKTPKTPKIKTAKPPLSNGDAVTPMDVSFSPVSNGATAALSIDPAIGVAASPLADTNATTPKTPRAAIVNGKTKAGMRFFHGADGTPQPPAKIAKLAATAGDAAAALLKLEMVIDSVACGGSSVPSAQSPVARGAIEVIDNNDVLVLSNPIEVIQID